MKEYRPPYAGAVAASFAVFGLYWITLAPSTAFWDASEYIATAHILGIPHPPGNPLFVVLGRVWSLLLDPLGLSVAVRLNLLAATTSAAASGFLFLIAHRVLWSFSDDAVVRVAGAAVAVLAGSTAYTVWNQSTVNEKVYTVSVLIILAASWLALRWRDRKDEPGSLRYLVAIVYLLVLGSTNHLMSVLPAPALLAFVAVTAPAVLLRRSLWSRSLIAVLVGLSFNFFLPIRAAEDPVINEGDPVCESAVGAATAVYTLGRVGCDPLAGSLTRRQYLKPPVSERQAPLADQLLNWFQYFDWQWSRGLDPAPQPGNARLPVTLLFLTLGFGGLWVAWRADRGAFWYLVILTGTLTVGLVFYLNFKYGYSLAPHITDQGLHEVRERDYFFVAGFLLWGGLAGVGLAGAWSWLGKRLGNRNVAAAVLVVAFIPLVTNWAWASRRGDVAARNWAYDLLMSVEPYGVLFTNGDNDTFPLWYLQEVENIREDVTVVVMQYLYTDWYPRQLQDLTRPENQRTFQTEFTAGIYDPDPKFPGGSIVSLPQEDMDRIGFGRTSRDFTVPLGPVAVQYPAGTRLDRAQRISLAIIRDSIGERPIYFASSGGLLTSLGLRDYGVRHGLVIKLVLDGGQTDADVQADPGEADPDQADSNRAGPEVVRISNQLGGILVDLDRSLILVREVYEYQGLRDRDVWAERATLNIPFHFYVLHVQLADAANRAGRSQDLVNALMDDANAFLETARGGRRGTPT